jgi:hypothetical protein
VDDVSEQLPPDHRAGIGVVAEDVEAEGLRQLATDADAAHAVAVAVESRRKYADADLAGNDGDDAAGDPALRRHADLVGPLAGEIVHPAGVHHRQHVLNVVARYRLDPGDRIDAVVGKRRCHHCQVAAGNTHRALPEIDVENRLRRRLDHAGVQHHVGDCAVAMSRCLLRSEDVLVDEQAAAGEARHHVEHRGDPRLRRVALDQLGGRHRAGVDHRVERPVFDIVEQDRVEGVAGRLDADMLEHRIAAVLGQDVAVDERLRRRLDRKGALAVAGGVDLAVDGCDGDAEEVGIGLGELGDVVGNLAVAQLLETGVEGRQVVIDRPGRPTCIRLVVAGDHVHSSTPICRLVAAEALYSK